MRRYQSLRHWAQQQYLRQHDPILGMVLFQIIQLSHKLKYILSVYKSTHNINSDVARYASCVPDALNSHRTQRVTYTCVPRTHTIFWSFLHDMSKQLSYEFSIKIVQLHRPLVDSRHFLRSAHISCACSLCHSSLNH